MDGFVKLVKFGIYAGVLAITYNVGWKKGYNNCIDEVGRNLSEIVVKERQESLNRLEGLTKGYYENVKSVVKEEGQKPVHLEMTKQPDSYKQAVERVREYLKKK